MTVREAERVIRSRIDRVLESGEVFLAPRTFGIFLNPATRTWCLSGTRVGGICAMGAFILGRRASEPFARAFAGTTHLGTVLFVATEMGTSERNVDAIIMGFDEGYVASGPPKGWPYAWYELGRKLRRIYCVE